MNGQSIKMIRCKLIVLRKFVLKYNEHNVLRVTVLGRLPPRSELNLKSDLVPLCIALSKDKTSLYQYLMQRIAIQSSLDYRF